MLMPIGRCRSWIGSRSAVVDGGEPEGRARVVLVAAPAVEAGLVAVPGDVAVVEVRRNAVRPLALVGGLEPPVDHVAAAGAVHAAHRYDAADAGRLTVAIVGVPAAAGR